MFLVSHNPEASFNAGDGRTLVWSNSSRIRSVEEIRARRKVHSAESKLCDNLVIQ